MGKSLFIVIAVCLIMSSGANGQAMSMSCSTVNGKMICNKESGPGNTAMSSSSSFSGPQGSSQNTYAGAGNPGGDWQSSQQGLSTGDGGPSPNNDYFDFNSAEFQGVPGGFDLPVGDGSSFSSSSSAVRFGTNEGPTPVVGGFGFASAGNFFPPGLPFNPAPDTANTPQDSSQPCGSDSSVNNNLANDNSRSGPQVAEMGGPSVGSFTYSSSGSAPNFVTNMGPVPTAGGFGFAYAGNGFSPGFPFNFVPGFYNGPPQSSPRPNGSGFATGGFMPGNFAGAGAAAGAGFPAGGFAPGGFDPIKFVFGRR